jgi:hypothetical protein
MVAAPAPPLLSPLWRHHHAAWTPRRHEPSGARTFFSGGPGLTPGKARSTMNAVSFVSPVVEPGTGVRAKTV